MGAVRLVFHLFCVFFISMHIYMHLLFVILVRFVVFNSKHLADCMQAHRKCQ